MFMNNYPKFKDSLKKHNIWYKEELVELASQLDLPDISEAIKNRDLYRWGQLEASRYVEELFPELSDMGVAPHKFSTSKMYIAVLDQVNDFMVPTLVAHSVLNAHLKFQDNEDYQNWFTHSFKKCTLRVNQKEFENILKLDNIHLGHENTTLSGSTSCIIVCPRIDNPNVLKFAKLWSPK